jgi:hypothetical protein
MPQAQLKKAKTEKKIPAKPYEIFHHWQTTRSTDNHSCYCSSQRIQTGNKVIKPKKAVLVRANTIHKKHTAGLQAVTEKTLAGRAGHLELLRGGKKDRKQSIAGKPTGGKAPKEEKKGWIPMRREEWCGRYEGYHGAEHLNKRCAVSFSAGRGRPQTQSALWHFLRTVKNGIGIFNDLAVRFLGTIGQNWPAELHE